MPELIVLLHQFMSQVVQLGLFLLRVVFGETICNLFEGFGLFLLRVVLGETIFELLEGFDEVWSSGFQHPFHAVFWQFCAVFWHVCECSFPAVFWQVCGSVGSTWVLIFCYFWEVTMFGQGFIPETGNAAVALLTVCCKVF
jgi:hypothetical protein